MHHLPCGREPRPSRRNKNANKQKKTCSRAQQTASVQLVFVVASDAVSFRVVAAGEPKPDMFARGRDVIVEGELGADGAIAASQVMTSCPSKYKPKQSQ